MRNKTMRIEFIGRKKTNRMEDFNYYISQCVYSNDLGDAILELEKKYVVVEVLNS